MKNLNLDKHGLDCKVLNFAPANQSNAPDIFAKPLVKVNKFLIDGIRDVVIDKISEHGHKLCQVGICPRIVMKESARATGIVFLSILAELPAVEREKVLQEFDNLTLQNLKI